MDEKFFAVLIDGEDAPSFRRASKEAAEKEAGRLSNVYNRKVFVMEAAAAVMPGEINVRVDSFETALKYLGRKNNAYMMGDILDKHTKAVVAIYKLITIAEAWNKDDNYASDFSDIIQYKCSPRFIYDCDSARFVCVEKYTTMSYAYAHVYVAAAVGPRFYFKSEERAEQFGKQFIDLWNDFLLTE